ncbi:MAG: hypothetical protein WCD76_20310, partial [Pyrinomonadaceae bacterium]
MKKQLLIFSLALSCGQSVALARQQSVPAAAPQNKPAQTQPAAPPSQTPNSPRQTPPPPQARAAATRLDLTDLGIVIEPEPRLIVMLAALDAAGWEPTPEGQEPSVFRQMVRKDLSNLDPALRARMQDFYRRHKLEDKTATAAEQAGRYISLAYALGTAPNFEAPARSDDLPGGLLEVLDFSALVREFYRASAIEERLPSYVQMHRAEGDSLRRPVIEMGFTVLAYLNTRPVTTVVERVDAGAGARTDGKKKGASQARVSPVLREKERRFHVVPALLAAPGAINFRVIADDYYAVVPAGTDPRSSELRRAYIQYLIDPLVVGNGKEIAAKRAEIKQLLDAERVRGGQDITPDIFLTIARSLVIAADARMDELARLRDLQLRTSERLKAARDDAARAAAVKESKESQTLIEDAATSQLAEAYERGAVLAFYFSEQLRGVEQSGFDVAASVPDMISNISPTRELRRPSEYAAAIVRAKEARKRAQQERETRARESGSESGATDVRRAALFKNLGEVESLLRVKNYTEAETRLAALKETYKDEPRVYLALGQAASLSAQDAFDENVQAERLNRALAHYRQAQLLASPDADAALLSRAYTARGRILAFLDRKEEAV